MSVTDAIDWVIEEGLFEAGVVQIRPRDAERREILLNCSLNRAEVRT